MANIIVIGGGIIGLCSAYYLQKEGHAVTVIDRGDITDGCSFGNMGYMSPSHFIPLASPGIIAEVVKHLLKSTSPFYIKPRLNANLMQWGYHFWKSSNAKTVEKNAPHLNDILQLSRNLMNDMRKEIGDHFEMQEIGCLMMCKAESTLTHEFQIAEMAEKFGLRVEKLGVDQVQQLEPDVELDVAGAVLYKEDCHFNPGKLMLLLKEHLKKAGVTFLFHTIVNGFEKHNHMLTSVLTDK